jgi:cell division protein FtsA
VKNAFPHGITPRLRPLPPRRAIDISVLDIGSSKIVCLIARLKPSTKGDILPGRSHRIEILGIGHQRAVGIKAGAVVDMEAAERSIRLAVDAAERMAEARIESVIVNLGAGRLGSEAYAASVPTPNDPVTEADIQRVLRAASMYSIRPGRAVLHSLPTGFSLEGLNGICDPRGMVATELGMNMHVVTADAAPTRNLMLCIERCHLSVEALVAAPYASGLSALADDEADIGVTLVDMGGGTTSVAVFSGGHFMHTDAIALGGHHVTMDIARGLSTPTDHAERLKTLHASVLPGVSDEHDMIAITPVGENDSAHVHHVPRSHLIKIVRPRVEETLELVRDRLRASGFVKEAGQRIVLTGGASQLTGISELAGRILGGQVRVGRPLGVRGLPEAARGPAFAGAVGLLVYPQVAGAEHFEAVRPRLAAAAGGNGYLSRMGQWLKESF